MHIEAVGFSATAPGSSGATASAFSGDSLTTKNKREGSRAMLAALWGLNQTAGWQQVTWPTAHDRTRGFRYPVPASQVSIGVYGFLAPKVEGQEDITATIAGSATAGDIEIGVALMWYEDVPGIAGRLIGADEAKSRVEKITTVFATLATGTSGGWSGSEVITAESDLLLANRDYAVLGAVVQDRCAAVGLRAPDWGGQRIAVPGEPNDAELTSRFFVELSARMQLPAVPVFNSGNKGNVLLDAAQDENGTDVDVAWVLGLLSA